jgi:hypothetical protein
MVTTRWCARFIPRLVLALLATAFFAVSGAHAQLTKIFVASTGNDANDGSRGAPKRNFQSAHDAVAAGGQIVVLDTAGYGKLNITKSISITVPPGVNGFVTVTGPFETGIAINAGPGSIVSLRGLIIEGGGGTSGSPRGVRFSEGRLYLEDCIIRNFGSSGVEASFIPSGGRALLVARSVQVRNCGSGFWASADSNSNPSSVFVLTDCLIDGCRQYGVFAQGDYPAFSYNRMTLTRCTLTSNAIGIRSALQDTTVYVDTCTLSGNQTGVDAQGSGKILTRGNNTFTNNSTDGAFTGTLPTK